MIAFAIAASASVALAGDSGGETTRASVSSAGEQANSRSPTASQKAAISADGGAVAFDSVASDLVDGDTNGVWDVFVREAGQGATTRVSVASSGRQGNGDSYWPAISADGRYVAFISDASNLVSGDTNGVSDVFVHDRQTGTTQRVSVDSAGGQGNNTSGIFGIGISADGRFVMFDSEATNLVAG